MSSWKISPVGVNGVLMSIKTPAEGLSTSMQSVSTAVSAGVEATQSPAIGQAVKDYFDAHGGADKLKNIMTRISECATGVAEATKAYVEGDETMAGQIQAKYSQAPGVLDAPGAGGGGTAPKMQ